MSLLPGFTGRLLALPVIICGRQREQPDAFADWKRREFPWGRRGTAQEVADVVTFLLSDRACWVNGANIPVDRLQGRAGMF